MIRTKSNYKTSNHPPTGIRTQRHTHTHTPLLISEEVGSRVHQVANDCSHPSVSHQGHLRRITRSITWQVPKISSFWEECWLSRSPSNWNSCLWWLFHLLVWDAWRDDHWTLALLTLGWSDHTAPYMLSLTQSTTFVVYFTPLTLFCLSMNRRQYWRRRSMNFSL